MSEWRVRPIVTTRAGLGDPTSARCERCGSAGPLTCQHLVKRSQGGGWSPESIAVLCGSGTTGCHGWAERNPYAAQAEGFATPPDEEPGQRPIRHYWLGLVYLEPDGSYRYP